jgi:hypothetical protein
MFAGSHRFIDLGSCSGQGDETACSPGFSIRHCGCEGGSNRLTDDEPNGSLSIEYVFV